MSRIAECCCLFSKQDVCHQVAFLHQATQATVFKAVTHSHSRTTQVRATANHGKTRGIPRHGNGIPRNRWRRAMTKNCRADRRQVGAPPSKAANAQRRRMGGLESPPYGLRNRPTAVVAFSECRPKGASFLHGAAKCHTLWGGGFLSVLAPQLQENLTQSFPQDRRIVVEQ